MPPAASWFDYFQSGKYNLLPTNGTPSSIFHSPEMTTRAYLGKRRRVFQFGTIAIVAVLVLGGMMRHVGMTSSSLTENASLSNLDGGAQEEREREMWGKTEQMGWTSPESEGLTDLGEVAEGRFRLNVEPEESSIEQYYRRLYDFAVSLPMGLHSSFLSSIHAHLPPSHPDLVPAYPNAQPYLPSMISYKSIHMTDKTYNPSNELVQAWESINERDGWKLNFLDDSAAAQWVAKVFKRSDVEWAWNFMHRGVLKADFLRYLLPLVEGGVYSDVDTRPIRPVEQWGTTNPEVLDLSESDGPNWRSQLSTHPSVIVAIDVDVHAFVNWQDSWPRPLGICQWTLSSAPNHPIFLDAVRRVVNASHVVEDWEKWREGEIERLKLEKADGWEKAVEELKKQKRDHAMNVMEWTGPGLFTDSVLAFLLARYNVTWHRLRGLHHPLRIGDVLILPITGFSPGGQKDFRAEGPDSPQANVLHNFRGSWKGDGA